MVRWVFPSPLSPTSSQLIPLDTIVAISTPPGEGGIGLVRLSGPHAISIGRQVFFSQPPLGQRVRHVEFGKVFIDGKEVDTGLGWVLKGPRSYTGEDTVEISCHGSIVVLESLVQAAISRGAVLAAPGEFTRRAFLHGRLDLLQAEAVIDLIQAGSQSSLDSAYGSVDGRLSQLILELKDRIVKALSLVEVGLDFNEEDIGDVNWVPVAEYLRDALSLATRLVGTFEGNRRRRDGILIAIFGRPNVGKSTLLNVLLGEDRAIVTPVPGTTRDIIEGRTVWDGVSVRLSDSAGIRSSGDPVEQEGVSRALRAAREADFVLSVLDSSVEWQDADRVVLDLLFDLPGLIVLNKSDLPRKIQLPVNISSRHSPIEISALTGKGLHALQRLVLERTPLPSLIGGVGLTRQRHCDCLSRVVLSLEKGCGMVSSGLFAELQEGLGAIGEMLGERIDDDILDRIFSDFCIGK